MKILKLESYDNIETYKTAFNDIVTRASFGNGPGYETISGAYLSTSLQILIQLLSDLDGDVSAIVNNERYLTKYIEASSSIIEIADDLSDKAMSLHQAAKAAKDLVKQIKSDIEKSTDTFISLEE